MCALVRGERNTQEVTYLLKGWIINELNVFWVFFLSISVNLGGSDGCWDGAACCRSALVDACFFLFTVFYFRVYSSACLLFFLVVVLLHF